MAKTIKTQTALTNIPRLIWANIRKMQYLKNIEDEKLALDLADWLVREHKKDTLKLVHRYTNKMIERRI